MNQQSDEHNQSLHDGYSLNYGLIFVFACAETSSSSQKVLTEEEKLIQFESLKENIQTSNIYMEKTRKLQRRILRIT